MDAAETDPSLPRPRRRRSFGLLMLADAFSWIVLMTLVLIAAGSSLIALALEHELIEPESGSDGSALESWTSATDAISVVALVLLLITLVLDTMAAVTCLRRLDGSRGRRMVPLLVLGVVTLTTGLPVLIVLVSLASILVDPTLTTALLSLSLVGVLWLMVSPTMRFAQLGYGIIQLADGEDDPQLLDDDPTAVRSPSGGSAWAGPSWPGARGAGPPAGPEGS